MNKKIKKFKKFISVTIILTMITALFMPIVSVQAAEIDKIEQIAENYTDVENSEYCITDIIAGDYYAYVYYSVPSDCKLVVAIDDGISGKLKQYEDNDIYANTNGSYCIPFNDYGNRKFTVKAFLLDENYCPLGKSLSKDFVIDGYVEHPSNNFYAEAHPEKTLNADGGKFNDCTWSLDSEGTLTISGDPGYYYSSENALPWNAYRKVIKNIVIEDNDYYKTDFLFKGLSEVESISIPMGFSADYDTFSDMTSLTTVTIEYNDSCDWWSNSFYAYSFNNCPNLTTFNISEDNPYLAFEDGVVYGCDESHNKTDILLYLPSNEQTSYTVPDTVTSIGDCAFAGAQNLKSISMSDNVTDIGEEAFKNCTSLTSINISKNLYSISSRTFYGCTNLKSIDIPNGVCSIYMNAFNSTGISEIYIPESIEYIYTDDYYSNIYYDIPYKTASYTDDYGNNNLKSITVSDDNDYFTSVDGVLYNKNMTTLYRYPGNKTNVSFSVPDTVTYIESFAFYDSHYLSSVSLGCNTQEVDFCAFYKCAALADIDLANVKYLSGGAFAGCSNLTSVYIPKTLYNISGAFAYCKNLKSFTVSEDSERFTEIDGCVYSKNGSYLYAYPNARGTKYTIPSDVIEISSYAFCGCSSLEEVIFPDTLEHIGYSAFEGCSALTKINLPSYLNYIDSNAFAFCTSLSEINFADELISDEDYYYSNYMQISDYVFYGCSNLKSIDLPDYDLYLYYAAFSNTGLESVTIPSNTNIDANVFYGSYNLKSITLEAGVSLYYSTNYYFGNFDDLTIYYSVCSDYSSYNMINIEHKDAIKWIPYDLYEENKITGTHTFKGLSPNTDYFIGMTDGYYDNSASFDSENIYYCDQVTSDSNGEIEMNYILKDTNDNVFPFAFAASSNDISTAEINVSDVIYIEGSTKMYPNDYNVTFNGKKLTEGVDYQVIRSGSDYWCKGEFDFKIMGIGKYCGIALTKYNALVDEYDVDGNGYIDISDATVIQYYLSGYKSINDLNTADFNGDGEVTVDDVTYLQKLIADII